MSSLNVRHLADPTPDQIEECTQVVLQAFTGDPFMATAVAGYTDNAEVFHAFMHAHVLGTVIGGGEVWVAEDGEKIVGVALWFPPGKAFLPTEEQREKAGLAGVMRGWNERLQKWWSDYYVPKLTKEVAAAVGETGKLDSHYMFVLSVLPSYHNRGIGKKLMLAYAPRAWEEDKRIVWEAAYATNVAKYSKWGGRALLSERYDSDLASGFTMTIMDLPKPAT